MAENANIDLDFLNRKEVARLLRVSERTIDKRIVNQTLPAYKIGGSIRFKKSEVLEYIESSSISKKLVS